MKHNNHGGLTLVPMPGFILMAEEVKKIIESKHTDTLVDIAIPEFGWRASGEPFVRLYKKYIGGHDCIVVASGPGTYEMLGQL